MAAVKKHPTSINVVSQGDGLYIEQANYGESSVRSILDVMTRHLEDYNKTAILDRVDSGFISSDAGGLNVNVTAGNATIKGREVRTSGVETIALPAVDDDYYIILKVVGDGGTEETRNPSNDTISITSVLIASYDSTTEFAIAKVTVTSGGTDLTGLSEFASRYTERIDDLRPRTASTLRVYTGAFPSTVYTAEFSSSGLKIPLDGGISIGLSDDLTISNDGTDNVFDSVAGDIKIDFGSTNYYTMTSGTLQLPDGGSIGLSTNTIIQSFEENGGDQKINYFDSAMTLLSGTLDFEGVTELHIDTGAKFRLQTDGDASFFKLGLGEEGYSTNLRSDAILSIGNGGSVFASAQTAPVYMAHINGEYTVNDASAIPYGLYVKTQTTFGSATPTASYGIYISDNNHVGGGTIATGYGLYIEGITSGTVDYAIYTNEGVVRFGDIVTTESRITVNAGGIAVTGSSTMENTTFSNDVGITGGDLTINAGVANINGTLTGRQITPVTDSLYDLGTVSKNFRALYTDNLYAQFLKENLVATGMTISSLNEINGTTSDFTNVEVDNLKMYNGANILTLDYTGNSSASGFLTKPTASFPLTWLNTSPTSASADIFLENSGSAVIRVISSSIRWKNDLKLLDHDSELFYSLNPYNYHSKPDDKRFYGFIAEHISERYPLLAVYEMDKDQNPTDIVRNYDTRGLIAVHVNETHKLYHRVNKLEEEITRLKKLLN